MKSIKQLVIVAVLLLLSNSLIAQENWYVLACNNSVQVGEKTKVPFGSSVTTDKKIILRRSSYLAVLSETGKILEFDSPGTYTLSLDTIKNDLKDFSASRLLKDSEFGRGTVCHHFPVPDILTPEGSFYEDDTVKIIWTQLKDDSTYTILALDMDSILYRKSTRENYFIVDSTLKSIMKSNDYRAIYFILKSDLKSDAHLYSFSHNTGNDFYLRLKSPKRDIADFEWRNKIDKLYPDDRAVHCFLKALLCIKRGLSITGVNYFKKAMTLRPDIEMFKTTYLKFLHQFEMDCD